MRCIKSSTGTVKISYSCMPNLKQNIDGRNKSTLRKTNAVPPKACNCRQLAHCPLDGNSLKSAVIYQATVAIPHMGASPNDQLGQLCHLNFILLLLLLLLFYAYCKFSGVQPWYNSLIIRDYSQTSISFYS